MACWICKVASLPSTRKTTTISNVICWVGFQTACAMAIVCSAPGNGLLSRLFGKTSDLIETGN